MNETAINWTDLTWNPVSGCKVISAGCKYCYAQSLAENKRGTAAFPNGFDLTIRPHKLDEPRKVKAPSLIFTNSMSDLFLDEIADDYRDRCFAVMAREDRHRYQVLTKRPETAARYFSTRPVPASVWLGVTVEHQLTADRIDVLRSIDAPTRFLSCEPLIGPLDLRGRLDGIQWVIGGGESGTHLAKPEIAERRAMARRGGKGESSWVPREDRYQWARDLRDACAEAGAAFWWKQWGGTKPHIAGRVIDGAEHNGMPSHPGAMPSAISARRATVYLPTAQASLAL